MFVLFSKWTTLKVLFLKLKNSKIQFVKILQVIKEYLVKTSSILLKKLKNALKILVNLKLSNTPP